MGRSSKLSSVTLAYYNYFAVFAFYFTAVLSSLSAGVLTYKTVATILAFVSAFIILINLGGDKKAALARVFVLMSIVAFIFAFGKPFYPNSSFPDAAVLHQSELLALVGQVIPAMMLAVVASRRRECQIEMMRAAPIVGVILSLVAIFTVLRPSEVNASGYVAIEGGLNYQSVSYMGAYAFAFIGYYIVCYDRIKWPIFFRFWGVKWLLYVIFFMDFIIVLLSGGRGGFAVLGIHSLLFIIMFFNKNNKIGGLKRLFFVLLLVFSSILLYYILENTASSFSAFARISGMFTGDFDTGRDDLRTMAIRSFSESPLLGHAFGSVFYAIGDYSHNIFTDLLVESGLVGLLLFIWLLYRVIKSLLRMSMKTIIDYLWLLFFVDGIGMALFSGYYLANIPMWWAIAFALNNKFAVDAMSSDKIIDNHFILKAQ